MRKRHGVIHTTLLILLLVFGVVGASLADPLSAIPTSPKAHAENLSGDTHLTGDTHSQNVVTAQIPDLDLSHVHAELAVQQIPTASGAPPLVVETATNSTPPVTIVVTSEMRAGWLAAASRGPSPFLPSRVPATPEPAALSLFATGLCALTARISVRRRRRRQQKERETLTSPRSSKEPV